MRKEAGTDVEKEATAGGQTGTHPSSLVFHLYVRQDVRQGVPVSYSASSSAVRIWAMFTLLKLLQSLVRTLHSDGAPGQIAAGVALGAALGLTPIANVHSVVIVVLLAVLNVSFGAGLLAWAAFVPIGFMLDPLFDRIGRLLLVETPALQPLWTAWDNTPGLALTNFNNTVVLGSVVGWLLLAPPVFVLSRIAVIRYRATIGERVRRTHLGQGDHGVAGVQRIPLVR
jgi:uncharacterized protein (TIGR03546 family)